MLAQIGLIDKQAAGHRRRAGGALLDPSLPSNTLIPKG